MLANAFNGIGSGCVVWLAITMPGAVFLFFADRAGEIRRLAWRMVPVGVFYVVYAGLVHWTERPSVVGLALANGRGVMELERHLHLAWEPWLSHHSFVGFGAFYDWAQLFVVGGVLIWLAVGEEDVWWRLSRNALALIAGAGFLVYWLLPVAPPWALPASYGIHSAGLLNLTGVGELMGAMPSLHTAWATWVAVIVWNYVRNPVIRWVAVGNCVLTVWVVLVTGNHYVLDVVAGESLAYCSCLAASWWSGRVDVVPERVGALV